MAALTSLSLTTNEMAIPFSELNTGKIIEVMDNSNWKAVVAKYGETPMSDRRGWYTEAAQAYEARRPKYDMLQEIVQKTGLDSGKTILEIGCGPGTATEGIVGELGTDLNLTAVEPNEEFCRITREKTAACPNVNVRCEGFEEFACDDGIWDAVLAATSIHWIPADIAFPKSARLLKPGGRFIILFNHMYQPSESVAQDLKPFYTKYAPALENAGYQTKEDQLSPIRGFASHIKPEVGLKHDEFVHHDRETTMSSDEYCQALFTYSPYLKLDADQRNRLFEEITDYINHNLEGKITVYHVSCYHLATKI